MLLALVDLCDDFLDRQVLHKDVPNLIVRSHIRDQFGSRYPLRIEPDIDPMPVTLGNNGFRRYGWCRIAVQINN